ncbi:MAG: GGDEF domain-containing protein [Burkholderiaceae bacterium]
MRQPDNLRIDALLKHLVAITGHRDHSLLNISVITALQELAGATQARVLTASRLKDEITLRTQVWIRAGRPVVLEEEDDTADEPLSRYPALAAAVAERRDAVEQRLPDGAHALWLPIWEGERLAACLEVVGAQPCSGAMRSAVQGILSVFRNFRSLLDYSERDSLTGLLNRKTFDENCSRRIVAGLGSDAPGTPPDVERRCNALRKEQWLAVVDIDHFKRVNDQFGHLYGDEVLLLVANMLSSSFRAHDRVFRFGGEEFVVLLRSVTLDDARRTFDRFRARIEQHAFPQVGRITVSLGFTRIDRETPVVILGHADQAMYHAKTHGRNQVCYYDELVACGALHAEAAANSVEFF